MPSPIAQGLSNVQVASRLLRHGPGLEVPKGVEVSKVLCRDDQ